MITKITGVVNRVLDEDVRLQVGPLEYAVMVPEFVRRVLQHQHGQEVTLHTSHYFEGNPVANRMVPRLMGFLQEVDLEFFDLFCTVDKVGIRKAMKAFVRPVREIADAIQRQDSKWLTTLPGIGPATAEQVVTTLRRKVTKFALAAMPDSNGVAVAAGNGAGGSVIEDAYQALLSVGHGPLEARERLDKALAGGKSYQSVEEILLAIYQQK